MVEDAEKYADESDRATHIEQQATEEAVDRLRRLTAPEQVKDEDGNWVHVDCVDCGIEIPEKRLELGKIRCVHCQHSKEVRSRQYAR